MPWFKVDDKLHSHRKPRTAGKAAMGVWVLAGSWSMDNDTDGFIPRPILALWGSTADARRLVAAGLWDEAEVHGEQGWQFHDWTRFQPSAAVTAAKKAAEHEAGVRGNHKRWHADRGLTDPDCEYCHRVPDREPDHPSDGDRIGGGESAPIPPVPVPEPQVPSNEGTRVDVERLCTHLADRIEANGSKRPSVGKGWRDAARLMLDRDGYTEDAVHRAIDWCQDSDFWRPNVLSMTKLREKYDTLRLQAQRERDREKTATVTRLPRFDELEEPPSGLSPAEYAAWELAQREKRQGR